jgi:hypothetical protein
LRDHWMETDKLQWVYQINVVRAAYRFRIRHIAYCLMRGRSYEEIEQPAKHNKPFWNHVEEIMEKHEQKAEPRTVQHEEQSVAA